MRVSFPLSILAEYSHSFWNIDPGQGQAYRQGETAPAETLLEQYAHTPCLKLALQAQIDGKTYQQAAEHYGRKFNSFKKHMKRAAKLLKAAYAA